MRIGSGICEAGTAVMVGATVMLRCSLPAACASRRGAASRPASQPGAGNPVAHTALITATASARLPCRGTIRIISGRRARAPAGPRRSPIEPPSGRLLEGMAPPARPAGLLSLPALLPVPFEELSEETLLLGSVVGCRTRRLGPQQHRIDGAPGRGGDPVELVLQRLEALPARDLGGEVHVLPLLMVARLLLQLLEALEQIVDEAHEALVAVGVLGPVVDG